jgi:hypothetical protein
MVAAPFKIAMTVRNAAGQQKSVPFTVSDVAAAFALFPSGASEIPLSSVDAWITDMVYTAAGTDTSQLQVFVNGVDTGIRVYNGANLGTVYNRQIQQSPIYVPAGATIKFTQLA